MKIVYDSSKNQQNILTHNLSVERAAEMDFSLAVYFVDNRNDYSEVRRIAVGYVDNRLHILCYTIRSGNMHVISFRKANNKEAKKYGKSKTQPTPTID